MKAGVLDQSDEQFDTDMNNMTVETRDTFASLLEFAANNDTDGFKQSIEHDISGIDETGLWYGWKKKGSKRMVLVHRTPLMIASTYGSIDIVELILSLSNVDVNRTCGRDKTTALHCAAGGGSDHAVHVVKLLLEAGADRNLTDANGHFPFDVILVSPKFPCLKFVLQVFLRVSNPDSNPSSNSPPLSSSPDSRSLSSNSDLISSPKSPKYTDVSISFPTEKKEYPIDPSLPDIKNGIYSTDEFRMFSFKIRPCSRAYSHDWTECPFVHPGENARRRDPRKYQYSCVPCPDFRKGACRRGDMCEYAHGIFECWLHPAQYRTRLCKEGTHCNRRVCFFAHKQEELRPLYVSTVPSPRSNAVCFQSTRFRPSLNARDILVGSFSLQGSFGGQSPGRMFSQIVDPNSPISPRVPMQQQFHSLSFQDLGSNSAAIAGQNDDSWSKWHSSNVNPDWTVNSGDFCRFQRSPSFELGDNGGDEPDLSWVQSLVKESPP